MGDTYQIVRKNAFAEYANEPPSFHEKKIELWLKIWFGNLLSPQEMIANTLDDETYFSMAPWLNISTKMLMTL